MMTSIRGTDASGAEFSSDGVFRYSLWRRWGDGPALVVIGCNPSTADESHDDPTIRRARAFAAAWGYDALRMLNIFPYVATNPQAMMHAVNASEYGEIVDGAWVNDRVIAAETEIAVREGGAVLAAWGNNGAWKGQSTWTRALLDRLNLDVACLSLTKESEPIHLLYQPLTATPMRFRGTGGRIVTDLRWCEICGQRVTRPRRADPTVADALVMGRHERFRGDLVCDACMAAADQTRQIAWAGR